MTDKKEVAKSVLSKMTGEERTFTVYFTAYGSIEVTAMSKEEARDKYDTLKDDRDLLDNVYDFEFDDVQEEE